MGLSIDNYRVDVDRKDDTIPAISVIMSVYNGERFLSDSISSILNQTFSDFEFIIVNDGSTDTTNSILERWSSLDKRIIIINQENIGLTKSLNKALDLAKADYIARQDADDISHSERLMFQKQYLDNNSDVYLLGVNHNIIDDNGFIIKYSLNKNGVSSLELKRNIANRNYFAHASVMFRRKGYKTFKYNEKYRYAQDYELWLNIIKKHSAVIVSNCLVDIRESSDRISNIHMKKQRLFAFIAKVKFFYLASNFLNYMYNGLFKDMVFILLPYRFIRFLKK